MEAVRKVLGRGEGVNYRFKGIKFRVFFSPLVVFLSGIMNSGCYVLLWILFSPYITFRSLCGEPLRFP